MGMGGGSAGVASVRDICCAANVSTGAPTILVQVQLHLPGVGGVCEWSCAPACHARSLFRSLLFQSVIALHWAWLQRREAERGAAFLDATSSPTHTATQPCGAPLCSTRSASHGPQLPGPCCQVQLAQLPRVKPLPGGAGQPHSSEQPARRTCPGRALWASSSSSPHPAARGAPSPGRQGKRCLPRPWTG